MNKPTHTAYVVIKPREGSDRKATWHEVGAVWPHKSGNGFDLVIPEGVSLSGRIVITERRQQAREPEQLSGPISGEEFLEILDERAAKA
jgi:hypothetical protein